MHLTLLIISEQPRNTLQHYEPAWTLTAKKREQRVCALTYAGRVGLYESDIANAVELALV